MEVRVGKLRNWKDLGKNDVMEEIVKGTGEDLEVGHYGF